MAETFFETNRVSKYAAKRYLEGTGRLPDCGDLQGALLQYSYYYPSAVSVGWPNHLIRSECQTSKTSLVTIGTKDCAKSLD